MAHTERQARSKSTAAGAAAQFAKADGMMAEAKERMAAKKKKHMAKASGAFKKLLEL